MNEDKAKAFRKIQISHAPNIPGTVEAITEILMDDELAGYAQEIKLAMASGAVAVGSEKAMEIITELTVYLTDSEIDQLITLLNSKRSKNATVALVQSSEHDSTFLIIETYPSKDTDDGT